MNQQTEIDVDEELSKMKADYREKTGEELPDHVLENYDEFFSLGPTTMDLQESFERGRKVAQPAGKHTSAQVAAVFLFTGAVAGLIGYGAGTALASNFGVVVVALVSVAFGFVAGAVATS